MHGVIRIVDSFLNVLAENFEFALWIHLFLLIVIAAMIGRLIFQQIKFEQIEISWGKDILFSVILIGEMIMIGITAYVYWINYKDPVEKYLIFQEILPDTSWVSQELKIYFVKERTLYSVNLDGSDLSSVFEADESFISYHFSPDGKKILIHTKNKLYLFSPETKEARVIEVVLNQASSPEEKDTSLKGSISSIKWAPSSLKFCYEVSRWSPYSSQKDVYIYDLTEATRKTFKQSFRDVPELYWDEKGQNLYFLEKEAMDLSRTGYAFDVKVFKVPLDSLKPLLVHRFPSDSNDFPSDSLNLRDIHLFLKGEKNSFYLYGKKDGMISEKGPRLGIDKNDNLFLVKEGWFRKRLFTIKRVPPEDENLFRYQSGGGERVIRNIRWLPQARYVIMSHKFLGVLVLDPWNGKIGRLQEAEDHLLGWYTRI